jgi:hypothetical protein
MHTFLEVLEIAGGVFVGQTVFYFLRAARKHWSGK